MSDNEFFAEAPEVVPEQFPFTPVFLQEVAGPWQEECLEAEFPWEATPALRKHWMQLALSSRPEEKESAIIALARCSRQSQEEKMLVNSFLKNEDPFGSLPIGVAIDLMLSGASPDPILYPRFWGQALPAEVCGDRFLAEMTSLWSRHPATLPSLTEISSQILHGENHFCWGVNPLVDDRAIQMLMQVRAESDWWPATAAFTSTETTLDRIENAQCSLELFGMCLRPHLTEEQWNAILGMGLDSDMSFAYLEHPVGMGMLCPPQPDWLNPHREMIEYAKSATSLGTVWRYWMPTLNYPWFREETDSIRDLPQLLALTLVGKPYGVLFEQAQAEGHGTFERFCLRHPTRLMAEKRVAHEAAMAAKLAQDAKKTA
jgi:hypothetical protein